ncbi:HTH_Tnp_Tc3_2 domain-containing protein [Trichonephila clavipes]|nr:HTH_Tnp_Tc3_2 domain-containing protein [Trichonephila clavipes]
MKPYNEFNTNQRKSASGRTKERSVEFSDESRFRLGATNGRVLVRRNPGESLQLNCLRPRRTGPTPGVMVWKAISCDRRSPLVVIPNTLTANLYVSLVIFPIVLPFINITGRGVFHQDNARLLTVVETQHVQRVVMCLDLRDHHIYLQLSTYGISLDDNSSID